MVVKKAPGSPAVRQPGRGQPPVGVVEHQHRGQPAGPEQVEDLPALVHDLVTGGARFLDRRLQLVGQPNRDPDQPGRDAERLAPLELRVGLALDAAGLFAVVGLGELDQAADHLDEMPNKGNRIAGHRRALDGHRDGQRHQILHQRVQGRGDDAGLPGAAGADQGHPFTAAQRSGQRLLTAARAGHGVERDVGGVQLLMPGDGLNAPLSCRISRFFPGHVGSAPRARCPAAIG